MLSPPAETALERRPSAVALKGPFLIVGDLHLGAYSTTDDAEIYEWLPAEISSSRAETLVLNGDTFELSFFKRLGSESGSGALLEQLLRQHAALFSALKASPTLTKVVLLEGDHDHSLTEADREAIRRTVFPLDVEFGEYAFHADAGTAVLHGHQFDYNRTDIATARRPLTDALTEVFEGYVLDGSAGEPLIIQAFQQGTFSFWYANGEIPAFLRATRECFGYAPRRYYEQLWKLLRSEEFKIWRRSLDSRWERLVGRFAQLVALLPPGFAAVVAPPWWKLCTNTFWWRVRTFARGRGRVAARLGAPQPTNVVLCHAHEAVDTKTSVGSNQVRLLVVVAPRWHVGGYEAGEVTLVRDRSIASWSSERGFEFTSSTESRRIGQRSPRVGWIPSSRYG